MVFLTWPDGAHEQPVGGRGSGLVEWHGPCVWMAAPRWPCFCRRSHNQEPGGGFRRVSHFQFVQRTAYVACTRSHSLVVQGTRFGLAHTTYGVGCGRQFLFAPGSCKLNYCTPLLLHVSTGYSISAMRPFHTCRPRVLRPPPSLQGHGAGVSSSSRMRHAPPTCAPKHTLNDNYKLVCTLCPCRFLLQPN